MFCRVDKKTGEILEGPRALPQNWGNVTGFNNLRASDVKKYGWYEVHNQSSKSDLGIINFSYIFLPEKEIVLAVPNAKIGLTRYAFDMLQQLYHMRRTKSFYSDVMGLINEFPNTPMDQLQRLNCMAIGDDYSCIVVNKDGLYEKVTVSHQVLEKLLWDARYTQNEELAKFEEGIRRIREAKNDDELKVLIDTNFVDIYD